MAHIILVTFGATLVAMRHHIRLIWRNTIESTSEKSKRSTKVGILRGLNEGSPDPMVLWSFAMPQHYDKNDITFAFGCSP